MCWTITQSVAAMNVFVSTNDCELFDANEVLNSVIRPVSLLSVTPVVRDVACVTVPPAPVVVVSKSTRWMDPSRISTPVILVLGIQPNNEGCYSSGHTLLL